MIAESIDSMGRDGRRGGVIVDEGWLQRDHGPTPWGVHAPGKENDLLLIASMGPRSNAAGHLQADDIHCLDVFASMGPRPNTVGC